VYILGLCTDISKLLLGIVSHSHRCSDSLLYLCLSCVSIALLAVAHHRQGHVFPDYFQIPRLSTFYRLVATMNVIYITTTI